MAGSLQVQLIGDWRTFIAALDGDALQARLKKQLTVANKRIGRQFVTIARRRIRAGSYAPNSPITVILKGSSRPLVDRGDLMQAITFDSKDWTTLKVGAFRATAGAKRVDLVRILHDGATIDVRKNPKVRIRVWAMVRKAVGAKRLAELTGRSRASVVRAATSLGLGRRRTGPMTARQRAAFFARQPRVAGKGGKSIWRIPARPFILEPLNSPEFVGFVRKTWTEAIDKALTGVTKKGPEFPGGR